MTREKNIDYGINKIPFSKEKRFFVFLSFTALIVILIWCYGKSHFPFPIPQWLETTLVIYVAYSSIIVAYLLLFRQFSEKSISLRYDVIFLAMLVALVISYKCVLQDSALVPPSDLQFDYSIENILIDWRGYKYYSGQPVIIVNGFSFDSIETNIEKNINADIGRVGIIIKLVRGHVILVRWLPQTWTTFPLFWKKVDLGRFEAEIYADQVLPITSYDNYLEIKEKL